MTGHGQRAVVLQLMQRPWGAAFAGRVACDGAASFGAVLRLRHLGAQNHSMVQGAGNWLNGAPGNDGVGLEWGS